VWWLPRATQGEPLAQTLRKEQGPALELALLEKGVLVLSMEIAVQLEAGAPYAGSELFDRSHERGGDPAAPVFPIDHQLVEAADRPVLAQVAGERQGSEADDPRVELGAQIPLARRGKSPFVRVAEGDFVNSRVRPLLPQKIGYCWKISSTATADARHRSPLEPPSDARASKSMRGASP